MERGTRSILLTALIISLSHYLPNSPSLRLSVSPSLRPITSSPTGSCNQCPSFAGSMTMKRQARLQKSMLPAASQSASNQDGGHHEMLQSESGLFAVGHWFLLSSSLFRRAFVRRQKEMIATLVSGLINVCTERVPMENSCSCRGAKTR